MPRLKLSDILALNLCMLGNFSCSCCRTLTFFKINFFKNYSRNTIRVSNELNPDQDRRSVDFTEPNVLPAPPPSPQDQANVNALKTCMIPIIEKGNFILV